MDRKIHKTTLEFSETRNFPIEDLCNLLSSEYLDFL